MGEEDSEDCRHWDCKEEVVASVVAEEALVALVVAVAWVALDRVREVAVASSFPFDCKHKDLQLEKAVAVAEDNKVGSLVALVAEVASLVAWAEVA